MFLWKLLSTLMAPLVYPRYPRRIKAKSTPSPFTAFQLIFPWNTETSIPFNTLEEPFTW